MASNTKRVHRLYGHEFYLQVNDPRKVVLHRTDGPAKISFVGGECWYCNDKLHRTDGPAIVSVNGREVWFQNGVRYEHKIAFDMEVDL